jgi:DNA-binding CsgD family transcriptional regulator
MVLPGSAPTIVNFDMQRLAVNSAFYEGLDPDFVASYVEHYAAINPWMAFWDTVASGNVSISERDSPSSAFRHTEFYADWLDPQPQMKAASGMRLDVDRNNTILVSWHYDLDRASLADRFTGEVLERVGGGWTDAVRSATMLRSGLENTKRLGLLIEQIDAAAFLVDADRRIFEANSEAGVAMVHGDFMTGLGDILTLRDQPAQRWLEETLANLLAGRRHQVSNTATFASCGHVFRVGVTRAPEFAGSNLALLVRPRPQALVVIRPLVGTSLRLDAGSLGLAFGLSAAETRLCEILVNGRSLAEAAQLLRLSEGTVRQRTKLIFQKTGTHRQGQLIALVSRFAADR